MKLDLNLILAFFISFLITVILSPFAIRFLRKLKADQTEREEGVQSHLAKAGTPTMGGITILIGITAASLIFARKYPRVLPVLALTLGFGLIGFLDDYLKVVKHRSDGLYSNQKMLLQFLVTTVFLIFIWTQDRSCLDLLIPFSGGTVITGDALGGAFKFIAIPLAYLAIIGTVNGVNFTDGLDGLSSSVTTVVAVFFLMASLMLGGGIEPIAAAAAGALLGFLIFNVYPAKVFMGDTGSLALGGFVAGCAYMLKMPLFILIIGLVYLVEVVSVFLQVFYFRVTGGKRLFKMAPIHHHFELCGWSEPRIVEVFSIVTVLLCLIALCGI